MTEKAQAELLDDVLSRDEGSSNPRAAGDLARPRSGTCTRSSTR